ncbi:TPA: TIGR03757 family integrating conjugative element protein [Proteus mirabilis]|uniref:TIGR03757 family integrating conjugative element protein n=1 Tax=Proteus mirabilis TaxID=584 RepID=UPI001A2CAB2A|nr:TIGR03757 family integrating conjugative element protein [Proteus mirabilis]MBI6378531.1 TIGR03757 family integrating conjugative element protein [Proteus mirabilis]MCU9580196.1 TIGR03757 family integrating conjugative element protein [Proteus mirabilis]HBC5065889.1 TIGR03757 family integrating conjugative element protein [Proteus mirabilis]
MKSAKLLIPLLVLSTQSVASTTIYADSNTPLLNTEGSHIIYLDAPNIIQQQLFNDLSCNPKQAEQQVRSIIQSSDWQQKQHQITQAYQGVLHAYTLKLAKYPAVVFDDRYVVYGTTDVVLAEKHLTQFLEHQ